MSAPGHAASADRPSDALLVVENLRTHVHDDGQTIRAVDGASFSIDAGETVCLVGESGSGKSITCRSLTGILSEPPAERVSGSITFDGIALDEASERELRHVRGDRIAHVFQTASRSLDPVYTVGDQLSEAMAIHDDVDEESAREAGIGLLRQVGLPRASERIDEYPHQLSGGMAQRVAIAIALAADPDLLIADEPTTSVDVTVQARLLGLFDELTGAGMGLLLVTHDLRVAATLADHILVMFGGTIVERGPSDDVLAQPSHPYTQALLDSYEGVSGRQTLIQRDDVPADGCRFRLECPYAVQECAEDGQPPFHPGPESAKHRVSCVHYAPTGDPSAIRSSAPSLGHHRGDTDE